MLIAAAGNAGPNSPPLFPAADKNVIAVTATDMEDRLYTGANRGNHIAVAAPGVDILVPAPGGAYQFTTGTSVAAAHVSGVVALLLERNPKLTPADVRRILTRTAKSLGPRDRTGAGLVNAYQAVANASGREAAAPKAAPKQAGGQHRPAVSPLGCRLHPPATLPRIVEKPQPEGESMKVILRLSAKPDKVDELKRILTGLAAPTRKEPGCLSYEIFQNLADPCDFTFVEEWASDAALDAHWAGAACAGCARARRAAARGPAGRPPLHQDRVRTRS